MAIEEDSDNRWVHNGNGNNTHEFGMGLGANTNFVGQNKPVNQRISSVRIERKRNIHLYQGKQQPKIKKRVLKMNFMTN